MDYSSNSAGSVEFNDFDDGAFHVSEQMRGRHARILPAPAESRQGVSQEVGEAVCNALRECLLGLKPGTTLPMGTVVTLGGMLNAQKLPVLMGFTSVKDFSKVSPGDAVLYQFREEAASEKQVRQVAECVRMGFSVVVFVPETLRETISSPTDVIRRCSEMLACPDIECLFEAEDKVPVTDWSSMSALSVWMTRVLNAAATPDVLQADLRGIFSFDRYDEPNQVNTENVAEQFSRPMKMYFSPAVEKKVEKYVNMLSGTISGSETGILISGPPGTGKSMLAEYFAFRTGRYLVATSMAGLQSRSPHLGQMLRLLRETFEEAQRNAPSILFFDEFDSVGVRSSSPEHHYWNMVINALLEHLQGVSSRGDVAVIASTNHPDCVDPAILRAGRMKYRLEMSLPLSSEIRNMLTDQLPGLTPQGILTGVSGLRGRNHADVAAFCKESLNTAINSGRDYVIDNDIAVTMDADVPSYWRTVSDHGRMMTAYALASAACVLVQCGGEERISGIVLHPGSYNVPSISAEVCRSTMAGYMQDANVHAAVIVALENENYNASEDEVVFRMRENALQELRKSVDKIVLCSARKNSPGMREAAAKTVTAHAVSLARKIMSEEDDLIWHNARQLFQEGYADITAFSDVPVLKQ